ncbi:hypothetical protein DK846_14855 [Methanospirillum lacunae]|uniref:PAS domain-containing protein n=2 Tax=Methanospirillum lacunae TaxID=668570 RepID=A0A2V2N2G5_9EURY|nr:hypothetical protein DK846_14855 [Methanospirillum lacunae]
MDTEQKKIFSILSSATKPLMISEIANISSMNRHTVARKLDCLEILGRVRKIEIGNAKKYFATKAVQISSIIDISTDLIFILNESWEIQYVNQAAQNFFEISHTMVGGKRFDLLNLEIFSYPEIIRELKRFSFERVSRVRVPHTIHDETQWYEISLMNISLRPGSVSIALIASNITKEYQTEQRLRENEAMYRSLFQYAPIAINEADLSQVKIYLDNLEKTGVNNIRSFMDTHPEVLKDCMNLIRINNINQKSLTDFDNIYISQKNVLSYLYPYYTPDTLDNFKDLFITLKNGSEYAHFYSEIISITGKIWYFSNYVSVASPDHDLSRVYISYLDITKQKNDHLQVLKTNKELIDVSEEIIARDREIKELINKQQTEIHKLRTFHSLFSDILHATNLPILIWDSSLTIIWISVTLENLCGYKELHLLGKPIWKLFPKSLQTYQTQLISNSPNKDEIGLVITLTDKSGKEKMCHWKCIKKIAIPDSNEMSGAILKEIS